ncbi:hypothetical protein [Herpetosiphon llansteffanensis]|uniref:hypothetical protein n=1 Tax=Herpetosiphon llansteffanensis TaxID=2094568 RepID=UPI000D7C5563|nr:hypothetical protein [Herpetosiphon llansteffanensis]
MQFTVLAASIKRGIGEHGTAIRLFSSAIGLLIAGQLCYRKALITASQHSLSSLWQVSQSFWGILGIGLILLSLIPWLALLARRQLSFFYPLWSIATIIVVLINWWWFGGGMSWQTLAGIGLVLVGVSLLFRGGHSI